MSEKIKETGTCCMCGKERPRGQFYADTSGKTKINYFPYCKSCIKTNIYSTTTGYIDVNETKVMLKKMNLPFVESVYNSALKDEKETFGIYIKNLNTYFKSQGRIEGYKEVYDISEKEEKINKINLLKLEASDEITMTTEELHKSQTKWGKGFEAEEYIYLEAQYEDLCHHYKSDDSYAMQLIFEEACHTRLTIKRKRERGEDVNKEVKTLQDLLASANIKPNQETSAGNIEKGSFGVFIAKIENEKPIPNWEKDLGGEDKMKSYIRSFFFGNLAKVLNIKNPWEEEFKEEMNMYTVDISEVESEKEKDSEDLLGNI